MKSISRVLAEIALFLAFASADEIDRDTADKVLEFIGGAISELSPDERAAFNEVVLALAQEDMTDDGAMLLRSLAGQTHVDREGRISF